MGFALGLMIPMILSVICLSKPLEGLPMSSEEIGHNAVCGNPMTITFFISHWDSKMELCRNTLDIRICGGYCPSSERGTWQHPLSKRNTTVCIPDHLESHKKVVSLCTDGVRDTRTWSYSEPDSCKCSICSSTNTSCLSATKRGMSESSLDESLPIFPITKDMRRRIALAERIMQDDSDDDHRLRIIPVLQ